MKSILLPDDPLIFMRYFIHGEKGGAMNIIGSSITVVAIAAFYAGAIIIAIWMIHSHFMDSFKGG